MIKRSNNATSKTDKITKEVGFSRRGFLQTSSAATLMAMLGGAPPGADAELAGKLALGAPEAGSGSKDSAVTADFPRVWLSSPEGPLAAESFDDVASHGVQVIETLDILGARKHGLKVMLATDVGGMFMGKPIGGRDATHLGLTPEFAVANGGTYNDLSIDSHTFAFDNSKHTVEIGLPFHFAPYDWKTKTYFTGDRTFDSYFGEEIFSTDRAFKAEVVVKQKDYDGQQHLAIIPAVIDGQSSVSLSITFDLTTVDGDLDHTMLAVYWRTHQLSPSAATTRETIARKIRALLDRFTQENGGTFPDDVICAMRYGDECFLRTGFVNSPKCAIPIYDYSDSGIAGFRKLNGSEEYPRGWGFPEFFGVNAYRDWLYAYHTSVAELVRAVVDEAHKVSPRLMVFRNTTRFNPTPFATLANDHDGCSAQLLAEEFDMLNPDPYPVALSGDSQSTNSDRNPRPRYIESMIPLENAYWAGLVRRMGKKVVPWMQAHTFSHDLEHPMPNDVAHMYDQVKPFDPDGIMWLGYQPGDTAEWPDFGMTLPDARPETWKALRCINLRAQHDLGLAKKTPPVAVLRFYAERSLVDLERRHLHDRFLTEQILTGLTIDLKIPYDVFEYYRREDLDLHETSNYQSVILCVDNLDGLPLDELKRQGTPLGLVCWNPASLTAHPEFTGITNLRKLPGGPVGITEPSGPGIVVPNNYSGVTEWNSSLVVTGPSGVTMPAGMAYGATLRTEANCIARAGDHCCVWRYGNIVFSSFLPKDPFDDGEYVRWLLNGNVAI